MRALAVAFALVAGLVGCVFGQDTCPCVFLPPRDCELLSIETLEPQTCSVTTTQCTNCICSATGTFTCPVTEDVTRLFFTDDTRTTCASELVTGVQCPTSNVAAITCSNNQQLPWGGFDCIISASDFPSGATITAGELGILQSSTVTIFLENQQAEPITGIVFAQIINEIAVNPTYFDTAWPNASTDLAVVTLNPSFSTTVTSDQRAEDVNLVAAAPLLTAVNNVVAAGTGDVTVTFDVSFQQAIGSFEGGIDEAFSSVSFIFAFEYTV